MVLNELILLQQLNVATLKLWGFCAEQEIETSGKKRQEIKT
jgi:hypothetical protein